MWSLAYNKYQSKYLKIYKFLYKIKLFSICTNILYNSVNLGKKCVDKVWHMGRWNNNEVFLQFQGTWMIICLKNINVRRFGIFFQSSCTNTSLFNTNLHQRYNRPCMTLHCQIGWCCHDNHHTKISGIAQNSNYSTTEL